MNIYRKIFFTITILLSSIFFSNIVYGKYIFNEELQAYDLTVRNLETNIRNFTIQNDEGLNYKILDGDKVVAENEVINSNNFEFDKKYKLEIYNNTKNVYILDINTEGTEINTFSKYVAIDVSADANNSCISKTYSGKRLSATSKKIIKVDSFIPSDEPLIYYFTISTKYVKMNLEQYPERIGNDSNLNLNFIISATLPSWDISATEDDNVTARLYNNTLEITGTGNMIDFTSSTIPWADYQSSITDVEILEGITSISNYAFYKCTLLKNINLPTSISSIGNKAFYICSSLEKIIIPDNVNSIGDTAFANCTSLTSIIIPNSVTKIGEIAFYNWTSEQTIYCDFYSQPDTWDSNWNYDCNANIVWKNMSWDISATEEDDVTATIYGNTLKITGTGNMIDFTSSTIPWADYQSSITDVEILEGITSISNYAFYKCTLLKNINLPTSISSIGNKAFYICSSLEKIIIPDNVNSIGDTAFANCTNLKNVVLSNNINILPDVIFYGCSLLNNVIIPDSVTSIGEAVFQNCTSLSDIRLSNNINSMGIQVFANCTSLISITIPETLSSLEMSTFSKCTNLKEVIGLENTKITSIPSQMFHSCSSLINVKIPENVTSINGRAFYNCTSLSSITIPKSVISTGSNVFFNWTSEQTIYCEVDTQPDTWDSNWNYKCNANIVWASNDTSNMSINDIENNTLEENIEIETVDIYSQDKSVNIYSNDINMENSDASEMPEDVLNENEVNIYSES